MKTVKVGIVGSGFIADHHVYAYKQLQNVEIVGIASVLVKEADKMKEKYGLSCPIFEDYKDLLKLPLDAVSLCVPNFLHEKIGVEALNSGKHIMVEKPIARNVQEGKKICEAAKIAGKQIFYCENNIYAPAFVKFKSLIDEGALGKVYMGRGKEQHSGPHSKWFYKKEPSGGGALVDLGIHDIACLVHFLGKNVKKVFCQTDIVQKNRGEFGECEVEDSAVGVLYFEDGAQIIIEESWCAPGGYDMKFELYGTNGQAIVDPCRNDTIVCYSEKGYGYAVEKAGSTKGWTFPVPGEAFMFGYPQEMAHFIDCIVNDKKALTDGEFGLQILNIVETMYKSAQTGKIEEVKPI